MTRFGDTGDRSISDWICVAWTRLSLGFGRKSSRSGRQIFRVIGSMGCPIIHFHETGKSFCERCLMASHSPSEFRTTSCMGSQNCSAVLDHQLGFERRSNGTSRSDKFPYAEGAPTRAQSAILPEEPLFRIRKNRWQLVTRHHHRLISFQSLAKAHKHKDFRDFRLPLRLSPVSPPRPTYWPKPPPRISLRRNSVHSLPTSELVNRQKRLGVPWARSVEKWARLLVSRCHWPQLRITIIP